MATKFKVGDKARVVRRPDGRLPLSRDPRLAGRVGRVVTIKEVIPNCEFLGARHTGYRIHSRRRRNDIYASYELEPLERSCRLCGNASRTVYCSTTCRTRWNNRVAYARKSGRDA